MDVLHDVLATCSSKKWPVGVALACWLWASGATHAADQGKRRSYRLDGGPVPRVSSLYFGTWRGTAPITKLGGEALKQPREARVEFVLRQKGRGATLPTFTAKIGRAKADTFDDDPALRIATSERYLSFNSRRLSNQLEHTYRRAVRKGEETWRITGRVRFSPAGKDKLHVQHIARVKGRARTSAPSATARPAERGAKDAYQILFEYKLVARRVIPAPANGKAEH